jgi:hypothetical protein
MQKGYLRYYLIYCINIYTLSLTVVKIYTKRGAQS